MAVRGKRETKLGFACELDPDAQQEEWGCHERTERKVDIKTF